MIKIQTNSRVILPGDTFFAIKGLNNDGHDYIDEAIKNGATKIVAEHGDYGVTTDLVSNVKEALTNTLLEEYAYLLKNIKFIGITGTNGKTTTAYLVNQMLNFLGTKTAYIGTLGFYIGNVLIKELNNTTPDILEIFKLIEETKEKEIENIVIEVSSHALNQKRLEGISFDIAAFTNLTQDHLDYHENMEDYLNAKLEILNKIKNDGYIVVNSDDEYSEYFCKNNYATIGYKGKDYKLLDFNTNENNTDIIFEANSEKHIVKTNLISKFNVYNYLMALAIVNGYGFNVEQIINITPLVNPPKGRCQSITVNDALVIVDYAHTPDAVEKIIESFNEIKKGKLYTIIGCGGDRDPLKRPIMANIATEKSDYVILTNDNPRTESELKIIGDMLKGIKKDNYVVEYDRHEAILEGLKMLEKDDILLILGKGHENYQIIGKEKIHFDDYEIVQDYSKKC